MRKSRLRKCRIFSWSSVSANTSNIMIVVRVDKAMMTFKQKIDMFAKLASLKSFSNKWTAGIEANPYKNSSTMIPSKLSRST